jgi:VanZ family protein
MLKTILYWLVERITEAHSYILSLNDAYEYHFTDKELHFLVIGLLGMAGIFILHPIFTLLAKKGHVMVITWLYVFTLIIVLTFAIEIGQKFSPGGTMEFEDIVFGVAGFAAMFAVFAVIRLIILGIVRAIRRGKRENAKGRKR